MPTPYGEITTTQDWLQPAVEDDEEMAEDVAAFDKAMEELKEEQDDL